MDVWHFSEQANPDAWNKIGEASSKISIPSELCDPDITHKLYAKYYDEWQVADELGLNIMVNEHHASANCMSSSCTLTLAILARITKNARLLALGVPIANRPDPVRIAEELSMIDAISGGRLEMGLIKASPFELAMSNQNPADIMERYWEAHALIVRAMSSRAPFSWEGKYFNYRNVNVWPRCYQDPHPPIWNSAAGASTARITARAGYRLGTPANGSGAKLVFDAYRDEYLKTHGRPAPRDRLGFLALVMVAPSKAEAETLAEKAKGYIKFSERGIPGYTNPPGYESAELNVRALRASTKGKIAYGHPTFLDGTPIPTNPSLDDLAASGIMFYGTPDMVYDQITAFSDGVGGIDHLLMHGQAGYMSYADTVSSLNLFAKEVHPRLREHHAEAMLEAAE